jgi:hypothetical protein
MKPVGLTLKRSRNKYQADARGELMLVHACVECDTISINRVAADDDPEAILSVFQSSLEFCFSNLEDVTLLDEEDTEVVHTQLFGQAMPTW